MAEEKKESQTLEEQKEDLKEMIELLKGLTETEKKGLLIGLRLAKTLAA